jgi:hypothetical protein
MIPWNIFKEGRYIDTVFYNEDADEKFVELGESTTYGKVEARRSHVVLLDDTKEEEAVQSLANREEWLIKMVKKCIPLFESKGFKVPPVQVTMSFPHTGNRSKRIGECWSPKAAADNLHHILITLEIDDSLKILGVLVHELCHAVVGIDAGHGSKFRRCAISVGLKGQMRSTEEEDWLIELFKSWVDEHGEIPHGKLTMAKSPRKKQATQMLKFGCPNECFIGRATIKYEEIPPMIECPICGENWEWM